MRHPLPLPSLLGVREPTNFTLTGMVKAKVFLITIHLHVNNVYCRGARPRPWGPIRLLAVTSHSNAATRPLLPAFPLLVQEDLLFKQAVQCGSDLRSLEQHLKKESLRFQLVQGPEDLLLAQLSTSLARVLFPKHSHKWLRDGVEMELVMTPTSRFQSSVGPRIEVSSRLVIEYCTEESVKVIDLTPPMQCNCSQQAAHPPSPPCHCSSLKNSQHVNCHQHGHNNVMSDHPRFNNGHTSHNCKVGAYECDICEAYDVVVRRRFSSESISPWVRKHL